jgi:ergothioneine biosynthesis protein EgtB
MLATQSDVPTRHGLTDQLAAARQQTDDLFALVKSDSFYERPIAERHRIIFYIGHLEAFDWNLFHERLGLKSFHAEFDRLFAFGIDPVGGGLPADQPSEWPTIAAVVDYVRKIRAALGDKLVDAIAETAGASSAGFSLSTLLNVAIEHRLMHAETLAYMLHQLPLDYKVGQRESLDVDSVPVVQRSIEIPAGVVTLGLRRGDVFGWDNEYEAHTVDVPAFAIDQYMVTNRQYLEFINAGGYDTRAFWDDGDDNGDWDWNSRQGISHPAFWKQKSEQWLYRTMFADVPLPLNWPVYVSQAEAKAYANWAGKALPTEAEWQRAAYGTPRGDELAYPWGGEASGGEAPPARFGNFDFARWSPTPVNAFPEGRSAFGVDGLLGNGWEWTSTVFAAFPGFEPFPFYRGYSADFFDGKHFVMKGGSARTAACMLRRTFRNWFQAHYQFIYTGFRCVSR